MKYLEYLIFRFIKNLLSIVPFRVLYIFSDGCSLFLQHVIRYRIKVVENNLRNSFPGKSKKRRKQITRAFYKHLCDVFLESIKGYSVSTNQLIKRYKPLNPEITPKYFERGQDIIIALSHYGNWEWGTQVANGVYLHNVTSFYKPMSNKYIDAYMQKLRSGRNMELLSIYDVHRIPSKPNVYPKAYFMVSDQNPGSAKKAYWTTFLNQDTACIRGVGNYSKLFNLPVIYLDVRKVKRGYYTVEMHEICTNPTSYSANEITQIYMTYLENIIKEKPEYWLWSHRRWKLKKP